MSDLRLIKEPFPLADKSTESVVQLVRTILSRGGIVKFSVDARKDVIDCWRLVSPEEASELSMTYEDALGDVIMEEFVPEDHHSSLEQLFGMFEIIEDAGYLPTQIISGRNAVKLREWLPMLSRKAKSLFGVPLIFGEGLPDDALVVCGSMDWGSTAEDIKYAVKVTLS